VGAGALSLSLAVPMILGANIGTTVTSTIVAMGYVRKKFVRGEFIRAAEVAVVDDIYNIMAVALFFTIEMFTGILSKSATWLAERMVKLPIVGPVLAGFPDFVDIISEPIIEPFVSGFVFLTGGEGFLSAALIGAASFAMLLLGLKWMSGSIQKIIKEKAVKVVDKAFGSPIKSFFVGTSLTCLLQSSSVTLSLAVPFAASGMIDLKKAFPYCVGADIGTTIDPSQIVSYAKFGLVGFMTGFVHVLLNVFGAFLFLCVPGLKELPVRIAERYAKWIVSVNPVLLIVCSTIAFYGIPFLVIFIL
jgi:sodium-dependent phosphate cotransporter